MKTISNYYFLLAAMLMALTACERDEFSDPRPGQVVFSFSASDHEAGRDKNAGQPASILITIKNSSGSSVVENKKIELVSFGSGYVSESIALERGEYSISTFIVLDENNKALYATPVAGSPKAALVTTPLPIHFNVSAASTSQIKPEVVEVTLTDSPASFGYASFGFEIVADEKVNASIKVELTVGKVIYLDVDTKVRVSGFNSANELQWSEQFDYVGPFPNTLAVKKGFHRYEFEINHFGIVDKRIIIGAQLIEDASGEIPVTYVMGGSREAKKLSAVINYTERPDPSNWGQTYLDPESKVSYEYRADGKLDKMRFFGYVDSLDNFVEQRYFVFTYEADRLSQLNGFHIGQTEPYIVDHYTYEADGHVSRIEEINYGGGITSDVNITYNYTDRLINAVYRLSNGTGFEYEFKAPRKNISSDKTTRFGSLCSTGTYTYDKNINPLAHLGYQDFLFQNHSINNKTSENVTYTGCAFPALIPETYQYKYDSEGFATERKTIFKSSNLGMLTKYVY